MEALNKHRKTLNGSKVLCLGAAYKKDIDDMRESPSLRIISLLKEKGAEVDYHDPYVPRLEEGHGFHYSHDVGAAAPGDASASTTRWSSSPTTRASTTTWS